MSKGVHEDVDASRSSRKDGATPFAFDMSPANGRVPVTSVAVILFVVIAIVAATVSPIATRPTTLLPPEFERAGAFLLLGIVVGVAYPSRLWLSLVVLTAVAISTELLQLIAPERGARVADCMVKVLGSLTGFFVGRLLLLLVYRGLSKSLHD